ncbi:hypothetical protein BU17DRAFT_86875 [Hysterangium stoloniferum]|nr:hypothetical protein BU17DRAFT_86875 [Hysterangium stoloniferum]
MAESSPPPPQPSATLANLPDQTLDRLLCEIDHPRDLLALALTSRIFNEIVFGPQSHMNFRWIICDPRRKHMWKELSQNPHLAARIRRVELVMEAAGDLIHVPDLPCNDDMLDEQEQCSWDDNRELSNRMVVLADALRVMTRLERFCWGTRFKPDLGFHVVATAVANNCLSLHELQIEYLQDLLTPNREAVSFSRISEPLWRISNLTSCSMSILEEICEYLPDHVISLMDVLVARSPDLEDLELNLKGMAPFPVPQLLSAHWPKLRRLTITGILQLYEYNIATDNTAKAAVFMNFLSRHPLLEALAIPYEHVSAVPEGCFNINTTPNLTSLSLAPQMRPQGLTGVIHPDVARRLTHVSIAFTGKCLRVVREFKSLQSINVMDPDAITLMSLAKLIPNIKRLSCIFTFGQKSEQAVKTLMSYVKPLTPFQHLTHLGGFFTDVDITTHDGHGLLILVAMTMPNLRYVELSGSDIDNHWIELHRGPQNNLAGYKRMDKREWEKLKMSSWGGFFYGFLPRAF